MFLTLENTCYRLKLTCLKAWTGAATKSFSPSMEFHAKDALRSWTDLVEGCT